MSSEKELIEPMEFFKIDKVSDDMYVIGPNVLLRFNVNLAKVSNGKRYHYYKEFEYSAKNIQDVSTLVTIKRSFDYYLSIENAQRDDNGNKVFIRIGVQEYILFRKVLEDAVSWFTDAKYKYLFVNNKGKLTMTSPIPEAVVSNLPQHKYIQIIPTIIDRGIANDDKVPGVRMILSDQDIYIDLTLDRLMGLYYLVSGLNMYQAALSIVNYVERPEFGTNRITMGSEYVRHFEEPKSGTTGVQERFVTPEGRNNDIGMLE